MLCYCGCLLAVHRIFLTKKTYWRARMPLLLHCRQTWTDNGTLTMFIIISKNPRCSHFFFHSFFSFSFRWTVNSSTQLISFLDTNLNSHTIFSCNKYTSPSFLWDRPYFASHHSTYLSHKIQRFILSSATTPFNQLQMPDLLGDEPLENSFRSPSYYQMPFNHLPLSLHAVFILFCICICIFTFFIQIADWATIETTTNAVA